MGNGFSMKSTSGSSPGRRARERFALVGGARSVFRMYAVLTTLLNDGEEVDPRLRFWAIQCHAFGIPEVGAAHRRRRSSERSIARRYRAVGTPSYLRCAFLRTDVLGYPISCLRHFGICHPGTHALWHSEVPTARHWIAKGANPGSLARTETG